MPVKKLSTPHHLRKSLHRETNLSSMEVIKRSKKGIHARDLKKIQEESGFSNFDLAEYLQIAERTLQRYLKNTNTVIDSAISERALLIGAIAGRGREVFGNEELFKLWLHASNRALGGISPNEVLDTTTGMHLVRAELNRIEHGVY